MSWARSWRQSRWTCSGTHGPLRPDARWAPLHGEVQHAYLTSLGHTIAGGTSEVLRSTVATRGLGLPSGAGLRRAMDFRASATASSSWCATARDFLRKHCPPERLDELDRRRAASPTTCGARMAELGWTGLLIPGEFGRQRRDRCVDVILLMEEMGRVVSARTVRRTAPWSRRR